MDIQNQPDVLHVLEWAKGFGEQDANEHLRRFPPELQPARDICVARGWVERLGASGVFLLTDLGAGILAEHRLAPTTPPEASGNDWILVSEAQTRLPFIRTLKQLYKYAEEHPDKLRLRPHPNHPQRRQANAADVLRLEMEYEAKQFEAMDSPEADGLPSFSEKGVEALAERVARVRAKKRPRK